MELKDWLPIAISAAGFIVAVIAVVFAGISASAARKSADTSARSADASERSAEASEKSVMVGAVRLSVKYHSYSTVLVCNEGHAKLRGVTVMHFSGKDLVGQVEYDALYPGTTVPVNTGAGIDIGDRLAITWTDPLSPGESLGYFEKQIR